jgi:hypothetical protein
MFNDHHAIPTYAAYCRSRLLQLACTSFFCTCYANDPEKENQAEKNRIHIGVVWSEATTEFELAKLTDDLRMRMLPDLIDPQSWHHFPKTEANFLIHCAAREYGDFLLATCPSLDHFDGPTAHNLPDGIHLVYNQLLLTHSAISHNVLSQAFLEQLHGTLVNCPPS